MSEESQGNNGAYQLITPPNLLKVKVGGSGTTAGIDMKAVAQAANAVESLAGEFEERLSLETAMLMKLAQDLEDQPDNAERIVKKALRLGHEVGGLGATFGFELVSDISACMCAYIENTAKPSQVRPEVLRAHGDAMRAVIKNNVRGDGGNVGSDLVYSLEQLVARRT